jgi:hypothetical protein
LETYKYDEDIIFEHEEEILTSGPSKTMATGAESRVVGPQQIIKLIISTTGCGTE